MADGGVVQWGLDAVVGIALTVGGGIVNAIRTDHKELEAKHDRLENNIPATYARRDDVKDTMDRVEAMFTRIEAKLDRKVDK